MRIAIVQSGLSAGGAEKIVSLLSHHRASLGDDVHVCAFTGSGRASYFNYPDDVSIHTLQNDAERIGKSYLRAGRRIIWLRRKLRSIRPDVIVSFLTKTNVITLLATRGSGIPVIISERNNPERQGASILWRKAMRLLEPYAAAIVMQTQLARIAVGPRVQDKIIIIPNPSTIPARIAARKRISGNKIVAAGRLSHQKGFDLLLQAFAIVAPQVPTARLAIFGEGPDRAALIKQAIELKIRDRIRLPGLTEKPGEWLAQADIFVLSSRYEGFPNVLVEAIAAGIPSIAFACPWGPPDILTHEKDGILVEPENVSALASSIYRLLSDKKLRKTLSEASLITAQRFDLASVMSQWDKIIEQAHSSVDTAGVPVVLKRFRTASHPRLHIWQLPAQLSNTRADQGLVVDRPQGEADQFQFEGSQPMDPALVETVFKDKP